VSQEKEQEKDKDVDGGGVFGGIYATEGLLRGGPGKAQAPLLVSRGITRYHEATQVKRLRRPGQSSDFGDGTEMSSDGMVWDGMMP